MREGDYIVPDMSNRRSTAWGKAFIWFIAVAVACLVEGALLAGSAWQPRDTYTLNRAPQIKEVDAEPAVEVDATRIIRFVATAVELARATK